MSLFIWCKLTHGLCLWCSIRWELSIVLLLLFMSAADMDFLQWLPSAIELDSMTLMGLFQLGSVTRKTKLPSCKQTGLPLCLALLSLSFLILCLAWDKFWRAPGALKPIGVGFQRAGQVLKIQKTPVSSYKVCSIVPVEPKQARGVINMVTECFWSCSPWWWDNIGIGGPQAVSSTEQWGVRCWCCWHTAG